MRHPSALVSSLALAVLVASVGQAPRADPSPAEITGDTVVARIGETTYTFADLREHLDRLEAPYRYAAERRLPEYVKDLVQREVLAREARRLGLDREPAVRAQLEEAAQAVLIQALSKHLAAEAMPSAEEVRAYYEAQADEFRLPEQVQVDQVQVATEQAAAAIRAATAAGQAFESAVEANSDAVVEVAGFRRGMREPAVERAAFALQPGEVSQPVRVRDGLYLLRLRNHLPARRRSLEAATPLIQARLSAQKRERLSQQMEDRLWKSAGVVVREDLLQAVVPPAGSTAQATALPKP